MQCFDTFRGFLHKIYAATMDGKGREGTYSSLSRRLGDSRGAGHDRAQGGSCPLPPRWRRPLAEVLPPVPGGLCISMPIILVTEISLVPLPLSGLVYS